MIVNIRIELDDTERNRLYRSLSGKDVKRLASRADVVDFVNGCVDAIARGGQEGGQDVETAPAYTPAELREIDRLRALKRNDSYIRGWIQVMRKRRAA